MAGTQELRALIDRWYAVAATGSVNDMQDFVAGLSAADAKAMLWTLAWEVERQRR